MKKLFFAIALISVPALGAHVEIPCAPITFQKKGSAFILQSGNYCLQSDLKIDGNYNWLAWEGSSYHSDDDVALVISASDVDVNLNGNNILSDARDVIGGVLLALVNTGEGNYVKEGYRKASWAAAYKNIRIHDGVIDLHRGKMGIAIPGSASGGSYSYLRDGTYVDLAFSQRLYEEFTINWLPPSAVDYPDRKITIESMKVKSPSYGIVVQGGGTVIRNSIIETDSEVGIWQFGPNSIIENNTIIVTERDVRKPVYKLRPHDAPIRLHQADGSIVRNNRIIMKRRERFSSNMGAAAIDLVDSKNVVIENNTVENLQEMVRKDTASTFVESGNTLR